MAKVKGPLVSNFVLQASLRMYWFPESDGGTLSMLTATISQGLVTTGCKGTGI